MKRRGPSPWEWLICAVITTIVVTILTPFIPIAQAPARFSYSVFGYRGGARAMVFAARQRHQNALHPGCGNGRELAGKASNYIAEIAKRDSATTKALLSDSDPEVRGTMALAAGHSRNPGYGAKLESLVLTDSDRLVRLYAVYALGDLGDASRGAAIRKAERSDQSSEVRAAASWALAKLSLKPDFAQLNRFEQKSLEYEGPFNEDRRDIVYASNHARRARMVYKERTNPTP